MVITHLRTASEPWTAELRLVRAIDGARLGEWSSTFAPDDPGPAALALSIAARELLETRAGAVEGRPPPSYQVPAGPDLRNYLLRLEQALAVTAAGMEGETRGSISGEREIIEGQIHLCVSQPANLTTRLLLAETLRRMKKVKPEVLREFRDKVELLQREKPLSEPAHGVVEGILADAFGGPAG